MSDDVSKLMDNVGSGKQGTDFPIGSLRQALLPAQLTQVHIFRASSEPELIMTIERWVVATQNIVVMPGPVTRDGIEIVMPVTYVPAYRQG